MRLKAWYYCHIIFLTLSIRNSKIFIDIFDTRYKLNFYLDCTLVNIGSSQDGGSASVTIPEGFYCPKFIDNTLWLAGGYDDEEFEVTQYGTTVSVVRIDRYFQNKGWNVNLKFHCCKNDGMSFNILGHKKS